MLYTLYCKKINIPLDLAYLGLSPCKEKKTPDIKVEITNTFNEKENYLDNQFQLDADYGFYYREGIGLFEFYEGRYLTVKLEVEAGASFVQTLLNFPMACIFAQQKLFPIHASAVRYKEKTFLFPGVTKLGKSSLAAILIKNGGKLITEDIALFKVSESQCSIIPSYPLIKLN